MPTFWQHVFRHELCVPSACSTGWFMLCLQRRSDAGGLIKSSLFTFQMLLRGVFVASFLQICRAGCLKNVHTCFKACSLLLVWTRRLRLCRVRPRSSFLTNFALSLNSPWHKRCRYKPASADNATDRNASGIPNKQDAQPRGEQEPQFTQRLWKSASVWGTEDLRPQPLRLYLRLHLKLCLLPRMLVWCS